MKLIRYIIIILLSGVLLLACSKPFHRRTPEAQAVGQTMDAFWSGLRNGDEATLHEQLTPDAAYIKVVERDSGVEVPLTVALNQPEDRAFLRAAERELLVNFEQPTPERVSLETYLEVTRRDDIQHVHIRWHLGRDNGAWRLNRIKTTVWTFPRPPRGSGP